MESITPFPSEPESVDVNALDPRPTGFLTEPTAEAFSVALLRILRLPSSQREALSQAARTRARQNFGMEIMCLGLEEVLQEAAAMGKLKGLFEKREPDQNALAPIVGLIALLLAILACVLIF